MKDEKTEIEARAARLKQARYAAGYRGAVSVSKALGINKNTYKAHETGRNGFGIVDAKAYASLFGVSLEWLNFGTGNPDDETPSNDLVAAPLISWVSAGALATPDSSVSPNLDEVPRVYTADLDPNGDWIALRVDGDSMDKLSPHDSIIFVNRKDKRLIPDACYVIGDGNGGATYKRYKPPNTWSPVSTNPIHKPIVLPVGQEPEIIGRVRKSVFNM